MRKLRAFYLITRGSHPHWTRRKCFKYAYAIWCAHRARLSC